MGGISNRVSKFYTTAKEGQWSVLVPALLIFFSMIKEIKVADPFLYKYLSEYQNFTDTTLNGEIYPYFAYSCLIATIPIFIFTDILLYKPTMYLEVLGQIVYRFFLMSTNDIFSQQMGHAMWGISVASEIGSSSYIYGKFEKDQYKKITSWSRAAAMAGRTGGYIFAQLLILTHIGNYRTLNTITFYILCVALVSCFLLPRVSWKQIVNNIAVEQGKKISNKVYAPLPISFSEYVLYRLKKLKSDFIKTYSNPFILKWSLWWAMAICMSYQVRLYYQTLLGQVQVGDDNPLNGFVEAIFSFIATIFIILTNRFPIDWDKWGETVLVVISALDAVFLVLFAQTDSVYVMYFCYIFYRTFFQVMTTIAQWNIAKKMVTDSYGLVFGVDSFIAVIMQSLLVRIVTDKSGLGMPVREAFIVYGALHGLTGLIFFISVMYTFISYCRRGKVTPENILSTDAQDIEVDEDK
ncbi:hypothetical protein FO519_008657 [Halicephalobus sp. NKZ332]|nr:hypothetical protein FO519_008657 [Halicephalobus sp. NKZ332]